MRSTLTLRFHHHSVIVVYHDLLLLLLCLVRSWQWTTVAGTSFFAPTVELVNLLRTKALGLSLKGRRCCFRWCLDLWFWGGSSLPRHIEITRQRRHEATLIIEVFVVFWRTFMRGLRGLLGSLGRAARTIQAVGNPTGQRNQDRRRDSLPRFLSFPFRPWCLLPVVLRFRSGWIRCFQVSWQWLVQKSGIFVELTGILRMKIFGEWLFLLGDQGQDRPCWVGVFYLTQGLLGRVRGKYFA